MGERKPVHTCAIRGSRDFPVPVEVNPSSRIISRRDIAAFLVRLLPQDAWVRPKDPRCMSSAPASLGTAGYSAGWRFVGRRLRPWRPKSLPPTSSSCSERLRYRRRYGLRPRPSVSIARSSTRLAEAVPSSAKTEKIRSPNPGPLDRSSVRLEGRLATDDHR